MTSPRRPNSSRCHRLKLIQFLKRHELHGKIRMASDLDKRQWHAAFCRTTTPSSTNSHTATIKQKKSAAGKAQSNSKRNAWKKNQHNASKQPGGNNTHGISNRFPRQCAR